MKNLYTGLLSFFLFFLLFSSSFASDFETRVLLDKTFVHDNTYCDINGKKLEVEIRSFDKYTVPGDEEYGEHVFIIQNEKYVLLPLNANMIGRYKLLKGKDKNCTKSLSLKTPGQELVLFFLKDNRPLLDTLTVVTYNLTTKKMDINETDLGVIKSYVENDRLMFSTSNFPGPQEVGQVTIRNKNYIFTQKKLTQWFRSSGRDFLLDPEKTFQHFEYKKYFSEKDEFLNAFILNKQKTKFGKDTYTYAIHHATKEECFSINFTGSSLDKNAEWICTPPLNKGREQKPRDKFDLAALQD